MRRLALAIALACVLSGAARAGEMPSTGSPAPTTPSTVTAPGEMPGTGSTVPGEIPINGATTPEESSTLLTIILTFIGIVS